MPGRPRPADSTCYASLRGACCCRQRSAEADSTWRDGTRRDSPDGGAWRLADALAVPVSCRSNQRRRSLRAAGSPVPPLDRQTCPWSTAALPERRVPREVRARLHCERPRRSNVDGSNDGRPGARRVSSTIDGRGARAASRCSLSRRADCGGCGLGLARRTSEPCSFVTT